MYKKSCPYCNGDSYSAASLGRWECPYCNADLTIFTPLPAGSVASGHSAGYGDVESIGSNKDIIGDQVRGKLVQLFSVKGRPGTCNKSAPE